MYPTEIRWEGVEWIHLAQGRDLRRAFVNRIMKLWVPSKAEKFLTS
jgi:hypothetical protein